MCGILCTIGNFDEAQIELLVHRGPDRQGDSLVRLWADVRLSSARLSIVGGTDVPVPYAHRDIYIAYNGEIYNWRALRSELSDGTPWETNCDTEVIARAWRRWGPNMLAHFNGMFALVLVDKLDRCVFLARDRAGEKPLFYASTEQGLCIASEIKALPIPFVEQPCREKDVLEFDCLATTLFEGVFRLPPGTYALLKSEEDLQHLPIKTWWTLPADVDEDMSWSAAVATTEDLLIDAVRIRLPDEVNTTILLSGGLDSALVQTTAKLPTAYCCTFPKEGIDCMPLASAASQGAEVIPVTFDMQDVQHDLERIVWHLDTPATWTALAQWFLAKQIHEDGYKVVLTGEGADELFGGYSRYRILWHLDQLRRDVNLERYAPLVSALLGEEDLFLARMLDRSPNGQARNHALTLVHQFGGAGSMAVRMMRAEWHTTMQLLLRMADRMMSAFSIENRAPFLDYRLIEHAARMPVRHKITLQESKAVLREVARRLNVSSEIVHDRNKRGLVVPWNTWTAATGERGVWDRKGFADTLTAAWRKVWF